MKFKPTIYISGQWFSLYFKYPKNIRKLLTKKPLEFFENDRVWVDGKEKTIDICVRFTRKFSIEKNWKEPDYILVEAFVKKEKVWFEMYSQQTPIRINENWEITFWFDKIADTLDFNRATLDYPDYENVEFKNNDDVIYKCEKFLNPKFAEKTYKTIRKLGLCSEPIFDSFTHFYDWKCLCCKGDHYISNPDQGYVIEKFSNPDHKPLFKKGVITYKNHYYEPCGENIYNRLVFYNKDEYQKKVLDYYRPKYLNWLNELEYKTKVERMSKKDFEELGFKGDPKPNFKEFATKVGSRLRVKKVSLNVEEGQVYNREDEILTPDVETEEVVTFDELKFEKNYPPFDEVWKIEMTQEEIDENGNSIGGAWRDLRNGEIIGRFSDIEKSKHEKVITLGFHTDQPPLNAVPCPVCRDLYLSLCRSGYSPLNIFQKLKERFYSLRFIIKHSKR